MVFDSGYDVWRVVAVGASAYLLLVLALRVSGKRTLSKMNAFDLVVTVALGSTLATVALSSDVSISEGAAAFALLCGAQFAVAWSSVRVGAIQRIVKAEPVLVLQDGRLLEEVCRRERLTGSEVRQAVRASGIGALEDVAAVVLETDGSLSVVPHSSLGSGTALQGIDGYRRTRQRWPS
jgi:uncharacterized membrane protein YcaP (DUF421 family)